MFHNRQSFLKLPLIDERNYSRIDWSSPSILMNTDMVGITWGCDKKLPKLLPLNHNDNDKTLIQYYKNNNNTYPINPKATNSWISNGKSILKLVLNNAVIVSKCKIKNEVGFKLFCSPTVNFRPLDSLIHPMLFTEFYLCWTRRSLGAL